MKKLLPLFIIFISTLNLSAQKDIEISVGAIYSHYNGLNTELSVQVPVANKLSLVGRVYHDFNGSYGFRTGLNYKLISLNRLSVNLGLEYNYDSLDGRRLGSESNYISHNLESTIRLEYAISSNFSIYAGALNSSNLGGNLFKQDNYIIDGIRLGLIRKF